MPVLSLSDADRAALVAAAAAEPLRRHWRRYHALVLVADGSTVPAAAGAVGCSVRSVRSWLASWRRGGIAGLVEGTRPGGPRKLDRAGEAWLAALLATNPQARGQHATGWTVPLLLGELERAGYALGETTLRRALHRLGYRWKRPRYVLGRPDPDYAEKKGPRSSGSQP